MSELPDSADRIGGDHDSEPDKSPRYSEVYSRSYDVPEEPTGGEVKPPVIIIQGRRQRYLAAFLLPLAVVGLMAAFLAGRATRPDGNGPLAAVGGRPPVRPIPPSSGDAGPALKGNPLSPVTLTNTKPDTPRIETIRKGADTDRIEKGKPIGPAERPAEPERPSTRSSFRDVSIRDLQSRIADAEKKAREKSRLETQAEERRKDEELAGRRRELLKARPLPMDQLHALERERLHRKLENALRDTRLGETEARAEEGEPGRAGIGDPLEAGTVWKGKRSYRQGAYEGITVDYELHVRERSGPKFKGVKFDNGAGRNRVDVEGWVVGDAISWIETHPGSVLTMDGTIVNHSININFSGLYLNRMTNVGDGILTRRDDQSLGKRPAERAVAKSPAVPAPINVVDRRPRADDLIPGTVWKGEKSYRPGSLGGKTVAFHLHVVGREGRSFKGHEVIDDDRPRRIEVEGTINGDVVRWVEEDGDNRTTMEGTILGDTIKFLFKENDSREIRRNGEGFLIRQ